MSVNIEVSESDENEMSNLSFDDHNAEDAASWLLSGVYCMLIVILSLVLCITHYITTDVTDLTVDIYFIFLCIVGSTWLVVCEPVVSSCNKNPGFLEIKSKHTTNRWLKGILVLFGLAIIIMDTLEFLATFQYTEEYCRKPAYFIAPLAQIVFIVSEVNFLFKFFKLHLQNFKSLNRLGVMHVIATNLSIWMLVIIDEAMEGVVTVADGKPSPGFSDPTTTEPTVFSKSHIEVEGCNMTKVYEMFQNTEDAYARTEDDSMLPEPFAPENCYCNTSYCTAVSSAHSFLYPFLVEFSLVSSCMMYIVWKNIGSLPHDDDHPIIKPSYKFYNSYKAFLIGGIIVTITVVSLVFINNAHTDLPQHERNYDSDRKALIIFNSYEVVLEIFMIIACVVAFALFRAEPRPVKSEINLDVVLLLVTIVGCMTLDVFYAFAVYTSMISKSYSYTWIWGAVFPIVDIVQCVLQVGFIIAGLSRQPVLETSYYEKVEKILQKSTKKQNRISECEYTNEGFIDDSRVTIEVPKNESVSKDDIPSPPHTENGTESTQFSYAQDREMCDNFSTNIKASKNSVTGKQIHAIIKESDNNPSLDNTNKIKQQKIAYPSTTRLRIREIVMFLLIANACLWTFWSLEGTTFKLLSYPYQYYTRDNLLMPNTWHSVAMICLPLSIFFRMHSCACLFEVWSMT